MDLSTRLEIIPVVFAPFLVVAVYLLAIHFIKFSKKNLVFYTVVMVAISILFTMFVEKGSVDSIRYDQDSYLWLVIYVVGVHIVVFPVTQYLIMKAWIGDYQLYMNIYNPTKREDFLQFHPKNKLIRAISYIMFFSLNIIKLLAYLIAGICIYYELSIHDYYPWLLLKTGATLSALFFLVKAFLCPFARCLNCKLGLFSMRIYPEMLPVGCVNAFKDKMIECPHCSAMYILSEKINVDDAKLKADQIRETSKIRKRKMADYYQVEDVIK